MFSEYVSYIIAHWPVIALLLVTVLAVWKVASFYFTRFKPIETEVGKFKTHADCISHRSDIDELRNIVRNIERILLQKDNKLIDKLSISRSPRQLNDSGNKLYEDSGAKRLMEEKAAEFIEHLEKRMPITALDVETESQSVLLSLSDEDYFVQIKTFIYNNPRYQDINIDLLTICYVMSLELRNLYLQKYPEIA